MARKTSASRGGVGAKFLGRSCSRRARQTALATTPAAKARCHHRMRPSAHPRRLSAAATHHCRSRSPRPRRRRSCRGSAAFPGSDFMVRCPSRPSISNICRRTRPSSFRAIHEVADQLRRQTRMPEFLSPRAARGISAVGMAHGYFKVTGKPLMTLCHGTVGLQHARDGGLQCLVRPRTGDHRRRANDLGRRPTGRQGLPTFHSAQRHQRAWCATFTKWDDNAGLAAAFRAVVSCARFIRSR